MQAITVICQFKIEWRSGYMCNKIKYLLWYNKLKHLLHITQGCNEIKRNMYSIAAFILLHFILFHVQ